jgi:hypothetical protein
MLTPVVRTCLFAGMGFGFFVSLYFALGAPPDRAEQGFVFRLETRTLILLLCALTAVGGVLGLVLGITMERAFTNKRGADKDKPWWKRGKSSRR